MPTDFHFSQPFMWDSCATCNFVWIGQSAGGDLVTCPMCGTTDVALLFPDPSHLKLLDVIGYFSERADIRAVLLEKELVEEVDRACGRTFTAKQLAAAARDLQQLWRKAARKGQVPDVGQITGRTRRLLNLSTTQEAERVWPILVPYSGTVDEHLAVPIITITFLEAMLDHLLETTAATKAPDEASYMEAAKKIEDLSSFEARKDYFRELTGTSLEAVMRKTPFKVFYAHWKDVREDRNEFVHGFPFALGAATAHKAAALAKDAVPLFGSLQNTFGVAAQGSTSATAATL